MGLFDELSKALHPHAERLNQNLAFQSSLIHTRLHAIENAVKEGGRGSIGTKWDRMQVKRKLEAGVSLEIRTCPVNEVWLIQAISSDGVQEKSPAFIITANGVLIESVLKEGVGFEGIGGNQVVLPGEELAVTARTEGNVNFVITIIRERLPTPPVSTQYGLDAEQFSPRQTHNIERDEIASRLDQFGPREGALAPTEGRQDVSESLVRKGQ